VEKGGGFPQKMGSQAGKMGEIPVADMEFSTLSTTFSTREGKMCSSNAKTYQLT